jgi:hypothetical protein
VKRYHAAVPYERREDPRAPRAPFSSVARDAIERSLPETGARRARWYLGVNLATVRWPSDDGRWRHVGLRRDDTGISGEYGESQAAADLEELALLPSKERGEPLGYRVKLDALLPDEHVRHPNIRDERELGEFLSWVVAQLGALGPDWLAHHLHPERRG